jgi:hypothetical protein
MRRGRICRRGRGRGWNGRRRRCVHRTGPSLRHDHTPGRLSLHRARTFRCPTFRNRRLLRLQLRLRLRGSGRGNGDGGRGGLSSSGRGSRRCDCGRLFPRRSRDHRGMRRSRLAEFSPRRGRPGNHWSGWRFACNRGGCRRWCNHDPRLLARLGNDPSRRRSGGGPLRSELTMLRGNRCGARYDRRTLARGLSGSRRWSVRRRRWRSLNRRRRPLHNGCAPSGRSFHRRSGGGCRRTALRGSGRTGAALRFFRILFSLLNCLQHVARFRYTRPVDLWLRLAFGFCRSGTVLATTAKMRAHPLRFVSFERAGMGLLLGHTDFSQGIENGPALYFQFAR